MYEYCQCHLVRMDVVGVLLGEQLSLGNVDHKANDGYYDGICHQVSEEASLWNCGTKTEN